MKVNTWLTTYSCDTALTPFRPLSHSDHADVIHHGFGKYGLLSGLTESEGKRAWLRMFSCKYSTDDVSNLPYWSAASCCWSMVVFLAYTCDVSSQFSGSHLRCIRSLTMLYCTSLLSMMLKVLYDVCFAEADKISQLRSLGVYPNTHCTSDFYDTNYLAAGARILLC